MGAINSADEAAAWAYRNIAAKNTLTGPDAQIVEQRFRARLSAIGAPEHRFSHEPARAVPDQNLTSSGLNARGPQKAPTRAKNQSHSQAMHSWGKLLRLRDKDHRRFVLRQACLVCGRVPSDSHHLTFTQPRALGRRVSDEFIVPICRVHHRELHRSGDEAAWWRGLNIDPLPVALKLWQQTRSDHPAIPDSRSEPKPAAKGAPSDRTSETPV
jgi:hypothetical protein